MTYRASAKVFSKSQKSISIPLLCLTSRPKSSRSIFDDQLALTIDGVMSITRPGNCLFVHMSCIASNPRYFQDESITISA